MKRETDKVTDGHGDEETDKVDRQDAEERQTDRQGNEETERQMDSMMKRDRQIG